MSRKQVTGAWYGDCALTGEWATLIRDSHIETSADRISLPAGQNVLFLRMLVRDGRMYLAGQGHQDGAAWLWDGATWRAVSAETNGQKVVAFGPLGLYVCLDGQQIGVYDLTGTRLETLRLPTGSGGIQYVQDDGTVVTGDRMYNGRGISDLAEWTRLDDLHVGQSYVSGAIVVRGADRRELEPGDCRFMHGYRAGASLACAMVTPGAFVAHWFDVADLPTFPREDTVPGPAPVPVPPGPVPPVPVPPPHGPTPPVPTPEPSMQLPASVLAIRARYVQRFPIPQTPGGGDAHEERCRQWSIMLASQAAFELPGQGWGMKRADANRPISKDTIARQADGRLMIWDLLVGTGTGTPTLAERPEGEDVTGQVFVPVTPTNSLGGVPSPPPSGDTHRYVGGGNDTGTCDVCGQPRAAAVHAIPESTRPHAYDGGEQDTGLCDICGKGRVDLLHSASPQPPGPTDPPLPAPGRCNCQAELAALSAQLSALRQDLQETAQTASYARMEAIDARAIAERVTSKPWPRLKLVVDAMADPISTNKTGWPGHAHQIRVRPVPE